MALAQIIDGKALAQSVREKVGTAVGSLKSQHNIIPGLTVILVGENPASQVYVRNKAKFTEQLGMTSRVIQLPQTCSQSELLSHINELNQDDKVHGILVQLPLPDQIESSEVLNHIRPEKDVDGFHSVNVGKLCIGQPCFVPCTPLGSVMLIKQVRANLAGAHAVIVGRSNIVGKPMVQLLLQENCTVSVAHSRTKDLAAITKQADILIAAVGRPEMITADHVKPGTIVIDVGINRVPAPEKGEGKTKLVGDVAFDEVANIASAITPVPGGVGPMTIACLLRNTLQAACESANIDMSQI
ncbi:MAG: bifunctional methylenetetrahydrofolate dehydrogenase/methenyltetrahydrofolate cyclohydrolase FolD [Pseudomonadota bacterium]